MTTGLTVVIGEVSAGHDILSLLGERLFWAVLLGALGLWLMVPRGAAWGRMSGAVVSAVSLGLFASHVPQLADWVERGVFWILSGMTILAAAATISARSPVYSAIWFALTLLGTPYRWGGNSPDSGFDCSGLVRYVFRSALGIELPRVSREMANTGTPITDRAALAAGDLVFFGRKGKVDHVGIYLGDGRFVHAPRTGRDVTVSSLETGYWAGKFLSARRVEGI